MVDYKQHYKKFGFVLWGHTARPWGYEILLHAKHSNNTLHDICMTFPSAPTQDGLMQRVHKHLDDVQAFIDNPPDALVVTEREQTINEVVDYLVKRGYLTAGQQLEDLPDRTPGTIEEPPKKRSWLSVVNEWLYYG